MQKISLVGLPGAGKTRLLNELSDLEGLEFKEVGLGDWSGSYPLLVLDSRSKLDEELLAKLLASSQGVILNFWQEVDLSLQAWWLNALKSSNSDYPPTPLPYVTKGFNSLTLADLTKLLVNKNPAKQQFWEDLTLYEFNLPKVVLEHLVFVLESARTQWNMEIWRATAVLNTQEYTNLVDLEVTPNRIDTFAAEASQPSSLKIWGKNLDKTALVELLNASIAQGEYFVSVSK